MKLRHKLNHGWAPSQPLDPAWSERVEREAEACSTAGAKRYAKAKARLQRAMLKAEREAARVKPDRPRLAKLWRVVELRRDEMLAIDAEMRRSPASAQHRGTGSHRGVGQGGPI